MAQAVQQGAGVEANGEVIGSVERIVTWPDSDQLQAVLVRHGRSDYLLRIPAEYLIVDSDYRLRLDGRLDLNAVERIAVESGRTPPTGEHIRDAGPTEPSPSPEVVLGQEPGLPSTYDGPATG
jgi:hypothetical protein